MASRIGFVMITTEHAAGRIFWVATGRKPGAGGDALAAPSWVANGRLLG
jgi:hypothetical protein